MKSNFVYALKSIQDGRIYVGMSHDPEKRLLEHNGGEFFRQKVSVLGFWYLKIVVWTESMPEIEKNIGNQGVVKKN